MPTARELDAAADMVEAISSANIGRAARMLQAGLDPNIPFDGRGGKAPVFPLGLACFLGYPEMVRLLLQHGASVDKRMPGAPTPLQTAIDEGNRGVVAQLLAAGADVHLKTGASMRTALHMAACTGDVQIIRKLIEAGAQLDVFDGEEYMPIHLAADEGNLSALKELVRAGSDPEWLSGALQTPLANACMSGRTRVAKHLLESCEVDPGTADEVGYTPLATAAQGGHVDIVRLLLKRGVVSLGRNGFRDALTGVAMTGNMEMLRELVQAEGGVHVAGAKTSQLMTALHFSAGYCHPRATALLLQAGADENAVDKNGETPLDVVDTKRSPHVRHGIERSRVRRMLMQGPAYRALSWEWPAPAAATPSAEDRIVVLPTSTEAVDAPPPPPPLGTRMAWPKTSAGLGQSRAVANISTAQWVSEEEAEEERGDGKETLECTRCNELVGDGAWRLNVAMVRRLPNADGSSPAGERAVFVAGMVRYSAKG